MHSPVPLAIAKTLADKASDVVAWARFDFRGVGASEGAYDDGRGEVDDARAVIDHAARGSRPGVPITVCGHSFGSWVGASRGRRPTAARRPGAAPRAERALLRVPGHDAPRFAGPTTIFVGDQDEFCDVDEARALADELGAELRVFEGFDHHFMKSRRAMAEAALPVIAPEVCLP